MNFKQLSVIALSLTLGVQGQAFAKKKKTVEPEGFKFTNVVDVPTTEVRNQESTGTCWAFAGTSFLETELIRLGAGHIDLSEMFTVRHAYSQKALQYFRLHGKGNFSEGGQAHDVLNVVKAFGFIPENAYSGNEYQSDFHIHKEMVKSTKAMLDQIVKNPNKTITPVWQSSVNGVFDTYMGAAPEKFEADGQAISPIDYMKKAGFNPNDYIELTSYSHHPYYKEMNLEIPDNWSHDLYYNLPIDELMSVMDNALTNGYSVCWDGDVSEKGFSHRNGVAILPVVNTKDMSNSDIEKWDAMSAKEKKASLYKFDKPGTEKEVDQALRQSTFDNYKTTDDHLMHLTGIVKDQNGTRYYKTKNSWSKTSNKMGGYLNMSEAYVRLKTVAIMIHKDAIPTELKAKLGL
jgi:bleomycin hydrolase